VTWVRAAALVVETRMAGVATVNDAVAWLPDASHVVPDPVHTLS
jgi:hypothetical protein